MGAALLFPPPHGQNWAWMDDEVLQRWPVRFDFSLLPDLAREKEENEISDPQPIRRSFGTSNFRSSTALYIFAGGNQPVDAALGRNGLHIHSRSMASDARRRTAPHTSLRTREVARLHNACLFASVCLLHPCRSIKTAKKKREMGDEKGSTPPSTTTLLRDNEPALHTKRLTRTHRTLY
eukprot:gene10718-7449_t